MTGVQTCALPIFLHIFEVGVQEAHQFNYSVSVPLTGLFILDAQDVFDHSLDVPAVFTHHQAISSGVIFHMDGVEEDKCTKLNAEPGCFSACGPG